jgi:hypothetical protein
MPSRVAYLYPRRLVIECERLKSRAKVVIPYRVKLECEHVIARYSNFLGIGHPPKSIHCRQCEPVGDDE